MELALRDKKIFQMNAELENRKKLLCLKRRQLMHNKRENNLLQGVLDDYEKYNKHIISNKERQIVFFQQLHSYIENITKDLQLTDHKLVESRNEQREITKEISFLKDELDNCANYFHNEILNLKKLKIIITLGKVAFDNCIKFYKKKYSLNKKKFIFKHGVKIDLPNGITLIPSYHPSPRNVNTKIINLKMMTDLFIKAKKLSNF